ncbi:PhzF family phenazine biosynthesis protein [Nonomuraea sp. NPDC050404]|uniref:PhzF family phenazine biosynthesis protein n=1 Tax=Nonomuraea sp. NPDC050404 TaxID=3155783 RepID=UPI00340D4B12
MGTAFKGKPAASRLLDSPLTAHWMQSVAAKPHLSKTPFLLGPPLPRFTSPLEITLCGHVTLTTERTLISPGATTGAAPIQYDRRHAYCESHPPTT